MPNLQERSQLLQKETWFDSWCRQIRRVLKEICRVSEVEPTIKIRTEANKKDK